MGVITDLRDLAALAQVDTQEIFHFILGDTVAEIDVPQGACAVITDFSITNADPALPRTFQASLAGVPQTEALFAPYVANAELMFVFNQGSLAITVVATALAGTTLHWQVSGYILPKSGLRGLTRNKTRVFA